MRKLPPDMLSDHLEFLALSDSELTRRIVAQVKDHIDALTAELAKHQEAGND